jgi:hypothetical protein
MDSVNHSAPAPSNKVASPTCFLGRPRGRMLDSNPSLLAARPLDLCPSGHIVYGCSVTHLLPEVTPVPRHKAPSDEMLKRAAKYRAGGYSWQDVRKKMGMALSTVCHWPGTYRVKWDAFYAAAEQEILAEASAESIHVLRQHLRIEDDDRSSRDAAGKLIRARIGLGAEADEPEVSPETLALARYLEGLTDADLDALIDRLAPRFGLARVAGPGGTGPPGGAA